MYIRLPCGLGPTRKAQKTHDASLLPYWCTQDIPGRKMRLIAMGYLGYCFSDASCRRVHVASTRITDPLFGTWFLAAHDPSWPHPYSVHVVHPWPNPCFLFGFFYSAVGSVIRGESNLDRPWGLIMRPPPLLSPPGIRLNIVSVSKKFKLQDMF